MPSLSSSSLRILWIKSGPVNPPNTGGRLRSFQMMKALNQRHEVHFLCLGAPEAAAAAKGAEEYCRTSTFVPHHVPEKGTSGFALAALKNLASPYPLALSLYTSASLTSKIRQLNGELSPDLVVCDFLTPALSMPTELLPRSVMFSHNVESQIWERLAANAANPLKRWYLGMQYRRMLHWEGVLSARFARIVTVSEADSLLTRQRYHLGNIAGHVPTGVAAESFADVRAVAAKPGSFCFLGSMDWLANIDAVQWFLREVWPALHARHPHWTFKVIGRKPPSALLTEFDDRLGVTFTGTVDDVHPHLAGSAAAVVPLRIGGGTRLKILELMAARVPVVATTIGAEGLQLQSPAHYRQADDATALAESLEHIEAHPEHARAMAQRAYDDVVIPNTWEHVATTFLNLALGPSSQPHGYGNVATRLPASQPS